MPKENDNPRAYDPHDHYFLSPQQREELKESQRMWRMGLILEESLKEKIKTGNPLEVIKEVIDYLRTCKNSPGIYRKFDIHTLNNVGATLEGIEMLVDWNKIKTFKDLEEKEPGKYELLIRQLNKISS